MTIWALIPLITCLSYIALFIASLLSPKQRVNRAFAVYLAFAGTWSFTSFILHLNVFPDRALLWNELLVGALVGTLSTYYYFIRAYVNKPAGAGSYLGFGFTVLITGLSLAGIIVKSARVENGVLYNDLGLALPVIGAVSITFASVVFYELLRKYRSLADGTERNRTQYLMAGWLILVVGAYTNFIPALAKIPTDHFGSLINALIIGYAISRYKLLDIKFVLSKGLVYSSLTIFLTVVYAVLLFVLRLFLDNWTSSSSIALAAVFAVLVVVLLAPLRNVLQKFIDRLFYRETYDYRQILLKFSHQISNVLELSELADSILNPIIKTMHSKQGSLLFPDPETQTYNTRFYQTADDEPPIKLRLLAESPIVEWLNSGNAVLRRETIDTLPQMKGLWTSERESLNYLGVEMLCPISNKGKLIGILVLGKKQSGTVYSDEEADLLMTMAHEAGIALENASMLDSLKSQQNQVEQLLAQVVLAQEEERKRISVDLHDSVAQWLVAASYHIQTCNHDMAGNNLTRAQEELSSVGTTINKSLKELRRVVIGLRPPALDELGLTHALRKSVEELRSDGLDGKFSEMGVPCRLPSSVEIAAYRIVQEALNNIRKHAGATQVNVRLQFLKEKLMVDISDNGKGFDLVRTLDSAVEVGHVGLAGMRQRVEMLGGNIKIKTGDGVGTSVVLTLPIIQKDEEE